MRGANRIRSGFGCLGSGRPGFGLILAILLLGAVAGRASAAPAPAVAPAAPAAPAGPAAGVRALADQFARDDFAGKLATIAALAKLGDGRAVPLLQALEAGQLYVTADKHLVFSDGSGDRLAIADPITRKPLGTARAETLDSVVANDALRNAIDGALSELGLHAADPLVRLQAARAAGQHPSATIVRDLQAALAGEKDARVARALRRSLAVAWLAYGTPAQQRQALDRLQGSLDPAVHGRIESLSTDAATSPAVRAAAVAVLAGIDHKLFWISLAGILFQGISLGSVLLLAAVGLAITFGVMGVINMAHGEMIMLGAYATYVVQQLFRAFLPPAWFDIYLLAAVPVAFLVAGLAGMVVERGVIRFLYGRPLETLLATWGVSLILQQLVRVIFGAPNKAVDNPAWLVGGFDVLGFTVTWNRLAVLLCCFLVLGAIALVMRRTAFGLHMRAVTQNREMAAAMGIAVERVDALTFGLGSGIAGIAGVALSQIGNVSPNLGTLYIVDSFLVVVFGGVGSLFGTLSGAMTLGILNKFLEPFAGAVLGKVLVLVAIILFIQKRPRGLFALKGRGQEG